MSDNERAELLGIVDPRMVRIFGLYRVMTEGTIVKPKAPLLHHI